MRNIVIALIVVIVALGAFYFLKDTADAPLTNSPAGIVEQGSNVPDGPAGGSEIPAPAVVSYTGSGGFSPASVTIKQGQAVRFVNNSESDTWPASAIHPTHGVYPQKSAADCLGSSFDACRGLKNGESWEFTFEHAGSWRYHDHLHTQHTGTVVVTE